MNIKLDTLLFYAANAILILFNTSDGITGLASIGVLLLIYFYLFFRNVVFAFLLSLVIISNPGRMFEGVPFGFDIHFLYLRDIFFYLSFLCLASPQIKSLTVDTNFKRLLPYFYLFTIYQIVISIAFKLQADSLFSFLKNLEIFKVYVFGIYIAIPAYKVILLKSDLFLKTIFSLTIIYTSVFLLSVYTDFQFVEFVQENRLRGGLIVRNLIQNAEIFKLPMYMSIAGFFLLSIQSNLKMFSAGLLSFTILLVAMYRLELTYTFLSMLLLSFLVYRFFDIKFSKILYAGFGILILLFIVVSAVPSVKDGLTDAFIATSNELAGNAPKGATQTRTIIELPHQLLLIKKYPFLGVGFHSNWWSNYHDLTDWGLSDIPLTSTIAMYGFIGMIIYYSRFYRIIKDSYQSLKFIFRNLQQISQKYYLEILAILSISVYFVAMVSFRLFYIGWELSLSYLQIQFGAFIGMFYGLMRVVTVSLENVSESHIPLNP